MKYCILVFGTILFVSLAFNYMVQAQSFRQQHEIAIHSKNHKQLSKIQQKAFKNEELLGVVIINRHGDRTGLYNFVKEEHSWELPNGALTPLGLYQGYELGSQLYKDYFQHVLGIQENQIDLQDYVTAQSTDVDRTVMTGRSMILGLLLSRYENIKSWNANCSCLSDQKRANFECIGQCLGLTKKLTESDIKIPLKVPPISKDLELSWYMNCEGFLAENKELSKSDIWKNALEQKFKAQVDLIKKYFATPKADDPNGFELCVKPEQCKGTKRPCCQNIDLDEIERLWDSVVCANSHNIGYSKNISNNDLLGYLQPVTDWLWHQRFQSKFGPDIGGRLLESIISRFNALRVAHDKARSRAKQSLSSHYRSHLHHQQLFPPYMHVYSDHDTMVFGILSALGVAEDMKLPLYCSNVIFELWEHETEQQEEDGKRGLDEGVQLTRKELKGDNDGDKQGEGFRFQYLKVKYNGVPINLKGCVNGLCQFDEFIASQIQNNRTRELSQCQPIQRGHRKTRNHEIKKRLENEEHSL